MILNKKCLILLVLLITFLNQFLNFTNDSSKTSNDDKIKYSILNDNDYNNYSILNFPQAFEMHSHLRSNPHNIGNERKFVIGLSTVKRVNQSYLFIMLDSLFVSMNSTEKSQIIVVLLVAEFEDANYRNRLINELNSKYVNEINKERILKLISAPNSYYPDVNRKVDADEVFNDDEKRIKWRTKQNFDISYLMAYCRTKATYYLQLEDDIISKRGFISEIEVYLNTLNNKKWIMIEFSPLGFIGKLFKTSDLPLFINTFILYANYKPVDMLHMSVLANIACDPGRDISKCDKNLKKIYIKYSNSLFQHIGLESSLKG